jgi:predicted GNAT superfamily acetyltransferase
VGFRSQSLSTVAYIHFVGVSPSSRSRGYGRMLYERFFEAVAGMGCDEVRCITSPVNTGSIAFHQRMGFEILPGDGKVGDVPVMLNHAGVGQHRVLFRKKLPRS